MVRQTRRIGTTLPGITGALGLAMLVACGSSGLSIDGAGGEEGSPGSEPLAIAAGPLGGGASVADDAAPKAKKILPPMAPEVAPAASPRLDKVPSVERLNGAVKSYFASSVGRRIYIQVDKPLYRPGETIWIKTWNLQARDLAELSPQAGIRYELISPKGAVVLRKRVTESRGLATNDFPIPDGVQGGEYHIKVTDDRGTVEKRPVIVSAYEPPRIKKKLEFLRKAYGTGDKVTATIEVKRPTGEPLANHPLRAQIMIDGALLDPVRLTTNADGGGLVRFKLPDSMARGDGLLTVLVDEGGITESISKRVPIILKKLQFSLFPEGGQVISGLPGRLYFEARNTINKPADVEGRIVDDHGNAVARFATHRDGLGRVDFTPSTGRRYHAEITRPAGISERYPVPMAVDEGCLVRAFDDLDGQLPELRVAVRCSEARTVVVVGMLRERLIDAAAVEVPDGAPAIVYLKPDETREPGLARAQGAARVTVFDEALNPLAERLVYRNRRARLQIKVEPDQASYTPREQVALKVTTVDLDGNRVPAEVALSVVDDTVISFADDKTGHMLSRLFLEPEIPGKVEEPNFYFDLKEKKSALAMDLLMGTRGYRRFEWQPVVQPPRPLEIAKEGSIAAVESVAAVASVATPSPKKGGAKKRPRKRNGDGDAEEDNGGRRVARAAPRRKAKAAPDPNRPRRGRAAAAKPVARNARPRLDLAPPPAEPEAGAEAEPAPEPIVDRFAAGPKDEKKADRRRPVAQPRRVEAAEREKRVVGAMGQPAAEIAVGKVIAGDMPAPDEMSDDLLVDEDWGGAGPDVPVQHRGLAAFAPVRVFPVPAYDVEYAGPRSDFRDTVYWAPTVRTGKGGKATVTFYLSDAVTSFRVFAEGVGSGLAGRTEKVFKSNLPFSLNVKLPLEVSAGDKLLLPLTLTNERAQALRVSLNASFGPLLTLDKPVALPAPELKAKSRQSLYYPLTVTGTQGTSPVSFSANAGGLTDDYVRQVKVVPAGFPQEASFSGTAGGTDGSANPSPGRFQIDLGDVIPGSVMASVKLYPSPVATLVAGLDSMLREPHGCFEQTSSTNYPNVMVLGYLKTHDVADAPLLQRSNRLIDKGYRRLVGFETSKKGYEWFGSVPGHEALTAYGLLEFADMRRVYGGVDNAMMKRTARWLKARRDGKGGFKRNAQALDSFGRAAPEVTNAYIIYSLSEAGLAGDFGREIATQSELAAATKDPYLLALATNTLLSTPARRGEGEAALARLLKLQGKEGVWTGAQHSITRSTGRNLHIETTALALLATMKIDGSAHDAALRRGVGWLHKNRGGFGGWGATQATVLALKAMTRYADHSRRAQSPGRLTVRVNGKLAADLSYLAGRREPLVLEDMARHFGPGVNAVEVRHEGKQDLPYSAAVEYRTLQPANHPDVAVELTTQLARSQVKMGENVRLTAVLRNRTDQGQPMTLARVGLPGGLTFQTWQLKELRDKGLIGFYETREREVILYFRALRPNETKEIPLDLVAYVPGEYTGPASSAYLYYTNDQKFWAAGLPVKIEL